MSYTEMKNAILFRYHKDINYWWRLLGEMFEGTDGFTKAYEIKCMLDGKLRYVRWDNYDWDIVERR
jgi:hypothetical protein